MRIPAARKCGKRYEKEGKIGYRDNTASKNGLFQFGFPQSLGARLLKVDIFN